MKWDNDGRWIVRLEDGPRILWSLILPKNVMEKGMTVPSVPAFIVPDSSQLPGEGGEPSFYDLGEPSHDFAEDSEQKEHEEDGQPDQKEGESASESEESETQSDEVNVSESEQSEAQPGEVNAAEPEESKNQSGEVNAGEPEANGDGKENLPGDVYPAANVELNDSENANKDATRWFTPKKVLAGVATAMVAGGLYSWATGNARSNNPKCNLARACAKASKAFCNRRRLENRPLHALMKDIEAENNL